MLTLQRLKTFTVNIQFTIKGGNLALHEDESCC